MKTIQPSLYKQHLVKVLIANVIIVLCMLINPADAISQPKRIVSLTVGSDEIIFDLLEARGELNRIAALSTLADNTEFSSIASKARKVEGRAGAQIEAILKLKPDLIVVAAYSNPSFLNKLQELKLTHIKLSKFSSIEDIQENIKKIAEAIGTEKQAVPLLKQLDTIEVIKGYQNSTMINYNKSGYIMGKNTIIDDLLKKSGLKNVVTATGWPKISAENLISLSPDYIISAGSEQNKKDVSRDLYKLQGWSQMKALKNGKIIMIESRYLSSTSHYVVYAYKAMVRQLRLLTPSKNK